MIDGWVYYSLAGLGVGALVGMTGVGGGSLMTPLLILLFGFHPATAVGTDLLFATTTKTVGTGVHGLGGTVDWRIVRRLAAGSLPGALATIGLLAWVGEPPVAAARIITIVLGVLLVLTAVAVFARGPLMRWTARHSSSLSERGRLAATVALGLVLGVSVSLSSVGAGALGVTALLLLYPDIPIARIAGTDIAHAVPLTLVGGIGHLLIGTVDLALLGALLIGSIPGVVLGSLVSARLGERWLRPILATVLAIVGVRLLL